MSLSSPPAPTSTSSKVAKKPRCRPRSQPSRSFAGTFLRSYVHCQRGGRTSAVSCAVRLYWRAFSRRDRPNQRCALGGRALGQRDTIGKFGSFILSRPFNKSTHFDPSASKARLLVAETLIR